MSEASYANCLTTAKRTLIVEGARFPTFVVNACLNLVLAKQKVRSCEVRIQLNRFSILYDCGRVVTCNVVAESNPCADHQVQRLQFQSASGPGNSLLMAPLMDR